MIIKCSNYSTQKIDQYELKKRWRKGFEFHAEYGLQSELGYQIGYSFQGYFNQYIFRKFAFTLEEAEDLTYRSYLKRKNRLCKKNHNCSRNCERREYTNGCGFCKTCGLFVSNVFSIEQFCAGCSIRTNWYSKDNKWWCESCALTQGFIN